MVARILESRFQSDEVLELLRRRGWFAHKVEFKGIRGGNDVVAIRNGRTVWIECKRGDEGPTLQQARRHREMVAHGAEVYVANEQNWPALKGEFL